MYVEVCIVYMHAFMHIHTHTHNITISFKCCTTKEEVKARHRDTQRLRQEACCKYKLAVLHNEYWASEDYTAYLKGKEVEGSCDSSLARSVFL